MAAREVREIVVRVDAPGESGLKKLADGFGKMNKQITEGTSVLKRFEQAYFRIASLSFAGIGLMSIVGALDSFQKLNDRLKQTEGSTEGAKIALEKLATVAAYTKSSVSDTSIVFTRMSQSMSDLNLGSDAVFGVTIALQNAFRAYGATTSEATAATIQLGQAFASGQLRGQELRSVTEASGLLAEVLAKKLGIARGELLKFAEKNGGIGVEQVLGALADGFDLIDQKASKLTPTLGESMTMALDKVKIKMGQFNEEIGATRKASEALLWIADNIDKITKLLGYAVGAYALYKAAVWAVVAAEAAHNLSLGISSAAIGLQLIQYKMIIPLIWLKVKALGALLLATGPVGLAFAAAGAALAAFAFNGSKAHQAMKDLQAAEGSMTDKKKESLSAMERAANAQKLALDNTRMAKVATDEMTMTQSKWREEAAKSVGGIEKFKQALKEAADEVKKKKDATFNYTAALAKLNAEFGENGNVKEYKKRLLELDLAKLRQELQKGEINLVKFNKEKDELINGKPVTSLKEFRGELSALNAEFETEVRTGSVSGYSQALAQVRLDKLNRDLKEGRTNFLDFHRDIRVSQMQEFNRELASGAISFEKYRYNTQAMQLRQLNEDWRAGTMDIYAYNKAVVETQDKFAPGSAFFVGTNNYIQQAGTLSQNVAGMVTNTFQRLEDSMVEFTKTGKFVFKDFAMAVLEDLNRIIIRAMIIRPIAQGIISGISGGAGAGASMESQNGLGASNAALAAKGAHFNGKASYFAKGGLVNGATPFSYGGGSKLGVMGEKGPEAIMPLKRTASGDLGVQAAPSAPVIVNITNNGGGEVQQKESQGPNGEKILDIIITKKVKEAFASGMMDKQMSQQYGLRRKGQ